MPRGANVCERAASSDFGSKLRDQVLTSTELPLSQSIDMSRFRFATLFTLASAAKKADDEAPKNAVVDYFMSLFNDVFETWPACRVRAFHSVLRPFPPKNNSAFGIYG